MVETAGRDASPQRMDDIPFIPTEERTCTLFPKMMPVCRLKYTVSVGFLIGDFCFILDKIEFRLMIFSRRQ